MPARHKNRNRLAARKAVKPKKRVNKVFFAIPLIGIALAFIIIVLSTSFGNLNRISVVTPDNSGNIVYSIYDFKEGSLTTVKVPGTTQLDIARNLGTWKLSSVWKLGQDEKIGGALLSETFTKSLDMPSFYWADADYTNLSSNNIGEVLRSVLAFKPTNLTLADRFKIGFFALRTNLSNRKSFDLANTRFLARSKIQDGSLGYKVSGNSLPFDIVAELADGNISQERQTILFENGSGKTQVNGEVGRVIEVMGGKVSSISKIDIQKGFDCVVYGSSKSITVLSIAKAFTCKIENRDSKSNFDVVVKVGENFAARY